MHGDDAQPLLRQTFADSQAGAGKVEHLQEHVPGCLAETLSVGYRFEAPPVTIPHSHPASPRRLSDVSHPAS